MLSAFQLCVPIPAVADAFSKIVAALRSKVVGNVAASCTLAALRDTLLPKLMSGEIRVKEAERFLQEVFR